MKANSTIEQRKCRGQEKRDQLVISKMEFNYQISQQKKNILAINSVWFSFLKLGRQFYQNSINHKFS